MRDSWRRTDDPPPRPSGWPGGVPHHTHPEYAPLTHQHSDGMGCLVLALALNLALGAWWVHQLQVRVVALECSQTPTLAACRQLAK